MPAMSKRQGVEWNFLGQISLASITSSATNFIDESEKDLRRHRYQSCGG